MDNQYKKEYLGDWSNLENGAFMDKMAKEHSQPKQHTVNRDLEIIIKKLDRIEKGIKQLTGLQLIKGVWQ